MTVYVMLVFFAAGGAQGGVDIDKVGIYDSLESCKSAAINAGFKPLDQDWPRGVGFSCVASNDPYGVE